MYEAEKVTTHRVNPIEWVIFLFMVGIFCNGLYSLMGIQQDFTFKALTPMASTWTAQTRKPASVMPQSLISLNISCDLILPIEHTLAQKVRLQGSLCTRSATQVRVINETNHIPATVFLNTTLGKYSTDYIPLNQGRNSLYIQMELGDGKPFSQRLIIQKSDG